MKHVQNYSRLTKQALSETIDFALDMDVPRRPSGVLFPLPLSPVDHPCHLNFRMGHRITNHLKPTHSTITMYLNTALQSPI